MEIINSFIVQHPIWTAFILAVLGTFPRMFIEQLSKSNHAGSAVEGCGCTLLLLPPTVVLTIYAAAILIGNSQWWVLLLIMPISTIITSIQGVMELLSKRAATYREQR